MNEKELLKPGCENCPTAKEMAETVTELDVQERQANISLVLYEHDASLELLNRANEIAHLVTASNTIPGDQKKATQAVKLSTPLINLYEKGHGGEYITLNDCILAIKEVLEEADKNTNLIMNYQNELKSILNDAHTLLKELQDHELLFQENKARLQKDFSEHTEVLEKLQRNCPGIKKKLIGSVACRSPEQ
jgi:hypothetical protein